MTVLIVVVGVLFLVSLGLAVALGRSAKRADKVTEQYFAERSGPDGGPR